jgi:cell wall assembly regulator SMI1
MSFDRTLAALEAWLAASAPSLSGCFAGPASEEAIGRAETALGRPLPEDYRAFLRAHDGQRFVPMTADAGSLAPMLRDFELLPVASSLSEHEAMMNEWDDLDGMISIGPVKPLYKNHLWWPISCIFGSSWFHCVDLDPAEGGVAGQIVTVSMKDEVRHVIAPSFEAFLEKIFDAIRSPGAEIGDDGIELEDDALERLIGSSW